MHKRAVIILILSLVILPATVFSQADSSSRTTEKSRGSLKLGLFAVSRLNYFGRSDSLRSSGFFPLLEVWANQHVYISAAPVFIHNNAVRAEYAGAVSTAGYMFRHTHWAGNSYISVPVYKAGTGLAQSRLKFQASSSFAKLTRVVNITLGADLKYSDQVDAGATAGLDHLFRRQTRTNWIWALNPSAFLYAGTQHFNNTTYKQSGFPLPLPLQQQVTRQVDRFSILSYEFSMPLIIAKDRFQLLLNPAYVIPQNLVQVDGRPDLSETGSSLFYLTAGMKYTLIR